MPNGFFSKLLSSDESRAWKEVKRGIDGFLEQVCKLREFGRERGIRECQLGTRAVVEMANDAVAATTDNGEKIHEVIDRIFSSVLMSRLETASTHAIKEIANESMVSIEYPTTQSVLKNELAKRNREWM